MVNDLNILIPSERAVLKEGNKQIKFPVGIYGSPTKDHDHIRLEVHQAMNERLFLDLDREAQVALYRFLGRLIRFENKT
jgi:hypothetical protein